MGTEQTFLRDTQAAARYGVSRVTVWRWAAQGKFPRPVKLATRCTRWRLSDILEWERGRRAAT